MDLQTFIQASLVQIANGIAGANGELKETGALVNPRNLYPDKNGGHNYGYIGSKGEAQRLVEFVEFDVAITVSQESEKGGKIGLMVGALGVGVGGKSADENSSVSRIRFKLPVAWPTAE